MDELTADRVARNESTFRDANERIVEAATDIGSDLDVVPFICECEDPACTAVLVISLADYKTVRRNPRRFLHAAVHDDHTGSVVGVHEHYVVVEKTGRAGEAAQELAGR